MIALFIALGRTVSWRAVGIDRRTSMDSTNYKGQFGAVQTTQKTFLELKNTRKLFKLPD